MSVYQAAIYVELRDDEDDRFWYGLFEETFDRAFTWQEVEQRAREAIAERLLSDSLEKLSVWMAENDWTPSVELWGVWQVT